MTNTTVILNKKNDWQQKLKAMPLGISQLVIARVVDTTHQSESLGADGKIVST
jgi:hypothetical protein